MSEYEGTPGEFPGVSLKDFAFSRPKIPMRKERKKNVRRVRKSRSIQVENERERRGDWVQGSFRTPNPGWNDLADIDAQLAFFCL